MSTGTLTLTQNDIWVTGSGTTFTTELAVGDVIFVALGGVNYSLVVSVIHSDNELGLSRAFTGNTESGVSWTAVPRDSLIGIHAQLAADTAWSRRAAILDKQNWYQVFSSTEETITVYLPDGTEFKGLSWQYITKLLEQLDIEDMQSIAAQVIDAKNTAVTAANEANASAANATAQATIAVDNAGYAFTSAEAARVAEVSASASSNTAKDAADRAAASASTIDVSTFARNGANNDITSISGLTTALSISQGGTGATTAGDARANLGITSLGIGQTWKVVSRFSNTVYTNQSASTIAVTVYFVASESVINVAYIDGVEVFRYYSIGADVYTSMLLIVPPGSSYIFTVYLVQTVGELS